MQCVLINLYHMYVVVSIVTESDYFNVKKQIKTMKYL
jgi:hypothetical protein